MKSVNPATGEVFAEYPDASPEQTKAALGACHEAFLLWRERPVADRSVPMRGLARLLRQERDRLAELASREMGKVIRESRAEVEKCAWGCDHFAHHAAELLAPEIVPTEAKRSKVIYTPLGVILAIMPWNFPFWQVVRFAAPALMAGNGCLLKHASNVPGCALAFEDLVRRAGFPEGLFRALLVPGDSIPALVAEPLVRGVTLTGSTTAGSAVAAAAGRYIKKTVLELGGSDAYLVLDDAELEAAAGACVEGRVVNSGQSCIAAKRFIVVESVLPVFEELIVASMAAVRMGDPLDEGSQIGPLARLDLRDEVHGQVMRSVAAGATLRLGGRVPGGPGSYYPPTVLTGVRPGMAAFDEEVFGPVAALVAARDEAEALRLANESQFGLGAAVFTRDLARGERLAERLEAGCCFVNARVRSDPRLPFGGVKASGYGRELGVAGIREFLNIKTICVA